jgi:hypothetical protein
MSGFGGSLLESDPVPSARTQADHRPFHQIVDDINKAKGDVRIAQGKVARYTEELEKLRDVTIATIQELTDQTKTV